MILPQETCRHLRLGPAAPDVAAYIAAHAGDLDEDGRRLMVRNGHARSRQVTTVAGAVEVQAPRVNDKRTDAAYCWADGLYFGVQRCWQHNLDC